ncbi:hypothetical protein QQS21_007272 [Conoideocrella luteorostrata]|uniref:AMP-dependent synthetase/ligase domain-containing protein n=1 Tax=Conoideocrella luteorostrata TaxID=1105319 RepID=A0AAJ0FXJ0_9HYPO|nr:hypothetical protein QQS21_007272 [Conoideocrella luteorostrata]
MAALRTHLSLLESSAIKHGSLPALKIPSNDSSGAIWKDVTFSQLHKDVETCARYWAHELSSKGWERHSVVGIWLKGTTYSDLLQILGISRAGFTPQLMSIRMPNPLVVYEILHRAGAVALIADRSFASLLMDSPFPVFFSPDLSARGLDALPELPPLTPSLDPDHTMMIFHTSGSTSGSPKLVPLSVKWIDFAITKTNQVKVPLPSEKQQVVSAGGSFCHMASYLLLLAYFDRGGCIIVPTQMPYSSHELQQMVSQCGLTMLNIFTSFLSKFFDESRQDPALLITLKGIEDIYCSGLPLSSDAENWAWKQDIRLTNSFACTEVGITMLSKGFDENNQLSVQPLDGTGYEFVPISDDEDSPDQTLVELVVPPASADCPDVSLRNAETGKFHTGDLFEEVLPGRYLGRGRTDDWIKMEGAFRCDTSSIEANAMQTCGKDLIEAAVVIGSERPTPVLIVEPRDVDGAPMAESANEPLKKEILQRIKPFSDRCYLHERIDDVRCILVAPRGSLPRTATKGNIRKKLVEREYQAQLDQIFSTS